MGNKFNSFGDYGYVESTAFKAKTYEVSISENDKIISVTENGSLLATVKLGLDNQTLSLIGKDGKEFSSVVLPSASVVESARYDEEKQALILTIKLADGTTKEIEISFTDMLDDYAKKEDVEKNTQAIKDEATTRAEADAKFTEKDIEIENTISTLDDRLTAKDAEIDEALTKKVDLTELEYEGGIRKAIVLGNHDTILGETTSAGTVNIAMVSKWDKVDLGSKSVEINLNGSAERPTYNDESEIALMTDISDMLTKTEASSVYQPKGDYLTKIPEEYVTNSELEESIKNKVEWSEFELNGEKRKSIVLGNYDTLLGTDTKGQTYNIGMISKWDKVDLGTSKLPINLNTPSGVRPTVQEAGQSGEEANEIAYLTDIQSGVYSLGEIESFNNLGAKASQKGICDNQDNVILTFKITTVPYGKESGFVLNIRNGNKISQSLYWKQALEPQMYRELTIDENGDIENVEFTANSNRTLYKDSLPNQTIFTLTTDADNETIKTALIDKLHDNKPLTAEQLDDCLKYGYYILESSMRVPVYVGWNGNSYTFTMVGLPNPKGDLVAATVAIAINLEDGSYSITRNGSRSTILTSDNIEKNTAIISLNATDNLLASKIAVLEEKLEKLSKTAVENVELNGESEATFSGESKDYIISGEETKSTAITGKTVKLDNLSISNNARTTINASDVEIKNVNISGEFPKDNGNSVVNINNAEYIVIRDMVFDSSNVYNGIEIGLSSETLPKSVLFENCRFLGKFTNNAILIFGTQDNAVININNCYFEDLSNPFRLSNNTNVKCTMNIINCKIDKWDVNSPWQGMMIFQDYTSGDADKANTNNLFAPEKITINVVNTIGPNNKKITMPSDISTICGTGDEKQLFYVWDNYRNLVSYDKSKYPTINIM